MTDLTRFAGRLKGQLLRRAGATVAWALRHRGRRTYRPGVTVLIVNWNSLPFLRVTVEAVRRMSPDGVRILVVDNASTDGSIELLRARDDVDLIRLPINVGHGVALDIGAALVDTEHLAVLDVDAFPVSPIWLDESLRALDDGHQLAGAHMHRNFIHPCFLVTRTKMLHDLDLTFRPVGSISRVEGRAPLFLDVGEALSQRVIVKFGGSQALHRFEITSLEGPSLAGAVFGGLVYHNMFATQGDGQGTALDLWERAIVTHLPELRS